MNRHGGVQPVAPGGRLLFVRDGNLVAAVPGALARPLLSLVEAELRRLQGNGQRLDPQLLPLLIDLTAALRRLAGLYDLNATATTTDVGSEGASDNARPAQWLTVREAAGELAVTDRRVRQLIDAHQLPARRHSFGWLIDPDAVTAYRARHAA